MKKLLCVLFSLFSVVSFACDGDNGCTCLIQKEVLACYNITNAVSKNDTNHLYLIQGGSGMISYQNDVISFNKDNIFGKFNINNKTISILCEPTYVKKTITCGSNDCKKPEIITVHSHNHRILIDNNETSNNCEVVFRKSNKLGVYKLIKFKIGNDILLDSDDRKDLEPNFKFPVIQISNTVVTKSTALKVESPYYGKDTTEARLQYEWVDPISNAKNTKTITIKNPQVYEDESMYTFGKNTFKDISVSTTIAVTYKTYYTNGIQEYTTDEKTILVQPIKGLK
jgi:hypothetical protein